MSQAFDHIQAPQHASLRDLREHVLAYMLANLEIGPYAQGDDNHLIRDASPFDFNTEPQGDPRAHLALGLVYGEIDGTPGRGRIETFLPTSTQMNVAIGYRLRPHDQDQDYGMALDLLQRMLKPILVALDSHVAPVNAQPNQVRMAAAPVPGRSPYLRLLVSMPILTPLEV